MELLEESIIVMVRFPEVVDLVFPESMVGTNGVVYTLTESIVAIASPVGLVTRIYKG